MKNDFKWLLLVIGLINVTIAAAADVAGRTFVMEGDVNGQVTARCRPKASTETLLADLLQLNTDRKLRARMTFNPDNSFTWSESGLDDTLIDAPGVWTDLGNKIMLRFDEDNLSTIKSLPEFIARRLENQGFDSQLRRMRYGFTFKAQAKNNKLTVMESGRYRIRMTGTAQGRRVSCVLGVKVKRVYRGNAVFQ